jgi:CheY-like chemotaxis protein
MTTILIVDDEPDSIDSLSTRLSIDGFDVQAVTSGAEALAQVAARRPDLVIVDLMMPGMTGFDLCRFLRDEERTRRIPIILYSALPLMQPSRGFYDCALTKPAEPDVLLFEINALLAASAAQRSTVSNNTVTDTPGESAAG